jgi:hypothetical protein
LALFDFEPGAYVAWQLPGGYIISVKKTNLSEMSHGESMICWAIFDWSKLGLVRIAVCRGRWDIDAGFVFVAKLSAFHFFLLTR